MPPGAVALTWLRLTLPLAQADLPQAPGNRGAEALGFAGPGWTALAAGAASARDLRMGVVLGSDAGRTVHAALREAAYLPEPVDDAAVAARALQAGGLMREWFEAEIARRRAACACGSDTMGVLLRSHSLDDDTTRSLDDDTIRRTLGGMLVGSIDATASSVAKIVAVLAASRSLAAQVAVAWRDSKRARRQDLWPPNQLESRSGYHSP